MDLKGHVPLGKSIIKVVYVKKVQKGVRVPCAPERGGVQGTKEESEDGGLLCVKRK